MRFHIAKHSMNRHWVNCAQMSFWLQIPKETHFKFIISRRALMLLQGCFCLVRPHLFELVGITRVIHEHKAGSA